MKKDCLGFALAEVHTDDFLLQRLKEKGADYFRSCPGGCGEEAAVRVWLADNYPVTYAQGNRVTFAFLDRNGLHRMKMEELDADPCPAI